MLFNQEDKKEDERSWLSIPIILLLSILLLFLNSLGTFENFKSTVSYVLGPIYTTSSNLAISLKDFFSTVANISEFRDEYNEMKLQIAEYEVDNLEYQLLLDENSDLKNQLELGNREDRYILAKVLDHIESEYLIVNQGSKEGIKKGDIAVIGDAFLGIVIESGQYTSKIRLPISKSNFLEVYILSSDEEDSQRILSRAVINGSSDGIRIENIGMNSGVKNGDIVVVNDSKVGENLIVGTIVGLSEDPATTTRTGYVSPAVDYYDLTNLFIRIENVD
ncbi:MAG: coiled-coil [candidate division WS6 bacterium 34_10]|uniref:Cell shape-determining protein MreC n=1 Tax=candidate division WS6 bacterium 34_10 TaxID=1641389 RepID=A0A101HHP8_9BACT|nr:MAG: coiled-coil [candidate division WS6 bacterium 34_10]